MLGPARDGEQSFPLQDHEMETTAWVLAQEPRGRSVATPIAAGLEGALLGSSARACNSLGR
jgi:hypothetical protein